MDVSFQPKSTQPEDVRKGPTMADFVAMYKGERKSVLVIILTAIIPVILLAIGGVSTMKSSLESSAQQKEVELQQKDGQMPVKPGEMAEMVKLSNRIKTVSTVVNSQPFMTTFLKLLEYSVEDDIIFNKTTLSGARTQGKDAYSLSIDAEAKSYSAVLNQIQTFRDTAPYNKFFSGIEMNNFSVGKTGEITFEISGKASIQGTNLTPQEVEKELLKVLSPKEMPSQEALNSLSSPQTDNQPTP